MVVCCIGFGFWYVMKCVLVYCCIGFVSWRLSCILFVALLSWVWFLVNVIGIFGVAALGLVFGECHYFCCAFDCLGFGFW